MCDFSWNKKNCSYMGWQIFYDDKNLSVILITISVQTLEQQFYREYKEEKYV